MAIRTGVRRGRGASGREHHHHHRHHARLLLAAGAAAGLLGAGAQARAQQWTVINLHPAGSSESDARAVHGVVQGGVIDGNVTAALWRGAAESVVRLNPREDGTSRVNAVYGDLQAGDVAPLSMSGYAALWSGSAHSWVNLHPPEAISSHISAMDGGMQGGSWVPRETEAPVHLGRACIWSGTPESWVDLNPPQYEMSNVLGMAGGQQVGVIWDTYTAALWTGTAESYVDLHPPQAFISIASCTDGTHQYGVAALFEPVPGLYPVRWSGTAESLVNMGVPEGWSGEIAGVHGGWQVGRLYTPDSVPHAAVWIDGPGSYVDLHDTLPPGYDDSVGNGIWRHTESGTTYVVGSATDSVTGRMRAMMWVTGPGVNLITGAGGPADCAAGVGDEMVFTARVVNAGAEASGPVTLTVTLPPASVATFVGSTPAPSSVSPTEVTIDLGPLAAVGGTAEVTVTLAAVGAGETAEVVFSASAAGEVHAENNTTTASSRITPVVPATAAATAIFSTDPALDNSLAPGTAGGRFNGFGRPIASPSGNWWLLRASTDLGDQARFVILRTPTDGQPELLLHEGVTQTPGGTLVRASGLAVNDAGVAAVAANDTGPSGGARFIARTTGSGLTDVARTGQPIPAFPDETYVQGPWDSVSIMADGSTAFCTGTFWGGQYGAYLTADGAQVIAQVGDTPDGAEYHIASMSDELGRSGRLFMDATGTQHIFEAILGSGIPTEDYVIVANGTAVVQQGVTVLPGMESPVASVTGFTMGAGGTWVLRGINVDGGPWAAVGEGTSVVRVIKAGEPIYPGAAETWRAHPYDGAFFAVAADAAGNFIVGGMTDRGNDFEDAVLVYNGEAVVARENDPVDLDGNGVFDDGVYIRSIDPDSVAFIPGAVLFTVTLRDADGALCRTNNTERGQAIVRVALPGGACPVDWNGDGSVNSSDISAFLTGWLQSLQDGTLAADFNGDNAVNSTDISAFLTAWLQAVQNGC